MGRPFNENYASVVWEEAGLNFQKWKDGKTGYPIVDAGMRCVRAMGWVHNRVRMVCAMFLSKHLMIDWREGESVRFVFFTLRI
jgi:deoxyribodipyrimidine photo-lyase